MTTIRQKNKAPPFISLLFFYLRCQTPEPMFTACRPKLKGKKIGLFGSYDWGDGEWMRVWQDDCRSIGADLVSDGVIACNEPDDEAVAACKALGASLA